ncbi:MAG: sugar phosphate isomerase/epimerase family protein [Bacillota bacterium]
MKAGVFNPVFGSEISLDEMLDKVVDLGLDAVEIGTGATPGNNHCKPDELLHDEKKLEEFKQAFKKRDLIISGLSCHGNPLHPVDEKAQVDHEVYRKTVLLAEKLEVPVVNLFSGCPGGSEEAKRPNWVTYTWPPDYAETLKWQWEEKVIPYWKEQGKFADEHGVKLAFEMHPGFVVYNPATLLKLREAVGEVVGANFDPSHLIWQGIEPVKAIHALKGAIYHFHAKDTAINPVKCPVNGVLDTTNLTEISERSWAFRSLGYGHGVKYWKDIVSALRMVDYDYVLSIEHEDGLASINEGLQKAARVLKESLLYEEPVNPWWTD